MTSETNTNTPKSVIKRVRRRNSEWHVTFTDDRPMLVTRQAVNGRFESQVSYGHDKATGAFNARAVTS